jgi:hypothetical protein
VKTCSKITKSMKNDKITCKTAPVQPGTYVENSNDPQSQLLSTLLPI